MRIRQERARAISSSSWGVCPEKGAHRAIEARAAGCPLWLAGKCREPDERRYFSEQVESFLGDGVEYVGEVSQNEKVELL